MSFQLATTHITSPHNQAHLLSSPCNQAHDIIPRHGTAHHITTTNTPTQPATAKTPPDWNRRLRAHSIGIFSFACRVCSPWNFRPQLARELAVFFTLLENVYSNSRMSLAAVSLRFSVCVERLLVPSFPPPGRPNTLLQTTCQPMMLTGTQMILRGLERHLCPNGIVFWSVVICTGAGSMP